MTSGSHATDSRSQVVGRTAADLLAAGADGGHVGRFLGDGFAHGVATVEEVSRSTKSAIGEIEALVAY